MLTKEQQQDLFNRAVAGLASQGFTRSVTSGGFCQYRGDGGKKCAVGWLMTDEQYNADWDIDGELTRAVFVLGFDRDDRDKFFSPLQSVHDGAYDHVIPRGKIDNPEKMKAGLRVFAEERGLEIPEVLK